MLRQVLLIGLAASGLSACAWGYDGYAPGYVHANANPALGPIYQGTQWGSLGWGNMWATPWTSPWGTNWGNPWGSYWGPWGGTPQLGYQASAGQTQHQPYTGELSGLGVAMLDEWLRDTPEGRSIVTMGFREAAEGIISEDVAHRANLWFRHYADYNRDMTLTDDEIRSALVSAGRYASPAGPAPAPGQPAG